jgi:hypothetical protein
MRVRLRFLGVLAALWLVAAPALAQTECKDQSLPVFDPQQKALPYSTIVFARLVRLEAGGCLGGPNDPGAKPTLNLLQPSKDAADREDPFRKSALATLGQIAQDARSLHTSDASVVYSTVALQVDAAAVALGTSLSPGVPAAWELQAGSGRIAAIPINLPAAIAEACAIVNEKPAPTCQAQFDLAKQLLRLTRLTKAALDYYARPDLQRAWEETRQRATKWDEYFSVARSQYPWELALNGGLMKDTRPVVDGVSFGFRDVPRYQVVFLHPYVSFEYAPDEPEGNRFAGIALVDLIGYNRWRWKDDGSMGFAVGGSLIIAMGDHANMDDIGWGAMLHLDHKWSIGVTFAGDKRAVLVSGDVAQLWTKASAATKARLKTAQ